MIDFENVPYTERTPEMVRDYYHRVFPLLREYERVVLESGEEGIDQRHAAKIALERIGLPPSQVVQVDAAVAYVGKLRDEMTTQCPQPVRDLVDAVRAVESQYAGHVYTAKEFADLTAEERAEHVAMIAEDIFQAEEPKQIRLLWTEALGLALPAVYAQHDAREGR